MKRILLITAIGLVALAGSGVLVLRAVLTPERLRAETARVLEQSTGLPVRLGETSLSLVPPGVAVRDLELGPEAEPVLRLGGALARFDLGPLLRRRVVVDRVALDGPRLVLGTGTLRATARRSAATPATSAGFRARVRHWEIRDGSLEVRGETPEQSYALHGLSAEGDLSFDSATGAAASTGVIALRDLDHPALADFRERWAELAPRVHYTLDWDARSGVLALPSLRVDAPPLSLPGSARVERFHTAPEITLRMNPAAHELADILPLVPPELLPAEEFAARGTVTVSGEMTATIGSGEAPGLRWTAAIDGVDMDWADAGGLLAGLHGEITGDSAGVRLQALRGRVGDGGEFRADGRAAPDPDLQVSARIDLDDVTRTGLLPDRVTAEGMLAIETRVHADSLDGTLAIENAGWTTPAMAPAGRGWNGSGTFRGRDLEIDRLEGSLGASRFDLEATVSDLLDSARVSVRGNAPFLDLVEMSPRLAARREAALRGAPMPPTRGPLPPLVPAFPPVPLEFSVTADSVITESAVLTGLVLEGAGKETDATVSARIRRADHESAVLHDAAVDLRLAGESATGTFAVPRIDAYGAPMRNVTGRLQVGADRTMRVTEIRGAAWTGSVSGTADIDLSDPDRPGFDITTRATELPADAFLGSVISARDIVEGTVDLESSFRGRGATPEEIRNALTGNGSFNARNGRLVGTPLTRAVWGALSMGSREDIPFRDLVTLFTVRNGRVISDTLTVRSADADWTASGSVGFDGSLDYRVRAVLSEAMSDRYRGRAGGEIAEWLSGTSGRLTLEMTVKGTATNPDVKIDRSQLAERAKESAKDEVENQIKGAIGKGLKGLLGGGTAPDSTSP